VGFGAVIFCTASLFTELCKCAAPVGLDAAGKPKPGGTGHMDVASSLNHLTGSQILGRGSVFFLYLIGFLISMSLIGLIPTVPIFIAVLMHVEGREKWRVILPMAAVMTLLIYGVFDQLLEVPWPPTVIGTWLPILHAIPSV
jgi:hypothetical protein